MKKLLQILAFALLSPLTLAQHSISLESQVYPAGYIPGFRVDVALSESVNLFTRAGFNFTDRRDWGVQDNEEGDGSGFGVGVEISTPKRERFSMNVRVDLWYMDIKWTRYDTVCPFVPPCFENRFDGTTEVTVLQPTIGFGYQLPVSGSFFLKPSVNLGYEINIKTKGEPVGEGAILLGGIQVGYRF